MTLRLRLGPRLSSVSWIAIETLAALAVFLLPFSKSAVEICLLSALALWLLRKWPWDEPLPEPPAARWAYPLFLSLVLISTMTGASSGLPESLAGAAKWFKYFGIFFMASELFADSRRRGRFVAAFLVSAGLVAADGFYQMFAGTDLVKGYSVDIPGRYVRMQGPFSSPNDLAAYLLFAAPFSFFFWVREKKWSVKSAALALLFALTALSFVLTLSRSGFVGLYAASFLLAAAALPPAAAALIAAAPLGFLFSPMLRYNFFSSLNLKDVTVGERLRIWETTLRMVRENPWIGTGVNSYVDRFASFAGAGETWRGYAHNCYLQMASETGVPSLVFFALPFFLLLPKEMLKSRGKALEPERWALLVSVPAFLVQSAFDTNFYALQAATLFWLFWGMFVGGTTAQPVREGATEAPVSQRASSGGRGPASGKISR